MNSDTSQPKTCQLSAEAKIFVPSNGSIGETLKPTALECHHASPSQYSQLPHYNATCYPFETPDGGCLRPRLTATWQGPGRPHYLHGSHQPLRPENTYLSENCFISSPKVQWDNVSRLSPLQMYNQCQYSPQELPDTHILSRFQAVPSGLTLLDVQYPVPVPLPAIQSGPNVWMVTPQDLSDTNLLMHFESGTPVASVQVGHVHPKLVKRIHRHDKMKKTGNSSNQISIGIQSESNEPNDQQVDERQQVDKRKKRTIICKDCETQTDFSNDVMNKNLQTLASPLYKETSNNWQPDENFTDSEEQETDSSNSVIPSRCVLPVVCPGDANLNAFMASTCSNLHEMNSQPWLMKENPMSYVYFSDGRNSSTGTGTDDSTYQSYNDFSAPGLNFVHCNSRYDMPQPAAHEFSKSFRNGICWNPAISAYLGQVPTNGTESRQLLGQKHGQLGTKYNKSHSVTCTAATDTGTGTGRMFSLEANPVTRGIQDVEEEFPKLFVAAGGLSVPYDNSKASDESLDNKLANLTNKNFECFKWTDGSFMQDRRNARKFTSASVREGLSKSSKKKQKRLEQLSRAADEELAEISLEQQVLREISSGHNRLMPPSSSSSVNDLLSPAPLSQCCTRNSSFTACSTESLELEKKQNGTVQPEMIVLTKCAELPCICMDDFATEKWLEKEDGGKLAKAKRQSHIKKVISKERDEKQRVSTESFAELSMADNNLPTKIGDVSIPHDNVDLSQSTSSKTSSMGTEERGTPASAELSPISQTSPLTMSSPTGSPFSSGITSPGNDQTDFCKSFVIARIHSPRFREYCNQILSREIDECCTELLQSLVRYHCERLSGINLMKRRTVLGLREVTKHLKQSNLCCVIISPNMERIQSKGGLDEALHNIIKLCEERNVLFVFALGRHALGRACAKLVPVSVVGIFSCTGAEEHFQRLQKLTTEARGAYQEMVASLLRANGAKLLGATSLANTRHSRTPSGCSMTSMTSSFLSEPISEADPELLTENKEDEQQEQNMFASTDIKESHISVVGVVYHDNSVSDESVLSSDESGDEEKVVKSEKLDYEADSENEQVTLQSSGASENRASSELVTKPVDDAPLQNSALLEGKVTPEKNGLFHSDDEDMVNTLPVSNFLQSTQHKLKALSSNIESWMANDRLSADLLIQKPLSDDVG